MSVAPKVYVIHENSAWLPPLRHAFEKRQTPYEEWLLDQLTVDLSTIPPEGVFFSRMSASNYTRGHFHANHSTDIVLRWLQAHGRRVINGSDVLKLEFSKAAQQIQLSKAGIATPKTVVAVGKDKVLDAARELALEPFIVKPNQGGKGLGVQLYSTVDELEQALEADVFPETLDDVWLVQEKIETNEEHITRAEFVGGKFIYAVNVFAGGSFELCPADACNVDFADFCPAGSNEAPEPVEAAGPRFEISDAPDLTLAAKLEEVLAANGIEVAGIEYIRRPDGTPVVYDINTNTNYNAAAEEGADIEAGGMEKIAEFLTDELAQLDQAQPLRATA
ncbi:MAG: alpha-L-glutamate ligase [Alphaproteobacteria bacterium]|nr:alpha-L-glutamate ligase [Alphaproteobacteria bacterium]